MRLKNPANDQYIPNKNEISYANISSTEIYYITGITDYKIVTFLTMHNSLILTKNSQHYRLIIFYSI